MICPLCDSSSVKYFGRKNEFELYKCNSCKLLFLYPLPELIDVYNKSYFSGAESGFGYVDYDKDKEPMTPTFEKYLDIVSSLGIKGGKLLDVGSATGFFMNIAKNRGFQVYGVELSDFAAKMGRKKGLNIITGDLEGAHFPDGYFDVVTMYDVLEHIFLPKIILSEVRRILRPGGLLVINTPDAESFVAKMFGSKWHLIIPPEHINYFSADNLSVYLSQHGFRVKISTKIGKRFTFQYIFNMLYRWQDLKIWNFLSNLFSKGFLSSLYIPINLRDNFFLVLEKDI